MTLTVDIDQQLGGFRLCSAFTSEGGLTALFGRSGAGKTSIVKAIAGLMRVGRGRIVLDGRVLVDTARGIFVPPHRREVGYVFQDARLFPHLTVRGNLLFGRWFGRRSGPDQQVDRVVDLLGLGALLERRPAGLSGGERQRVAIGRALLSRPRILLMDEPLAAIDEGRKGEILPFIERLRDEIGLPIVYVSHSIPEVVRLANTIAIVSDGAVQAYGPATEILGRPDLFPLVGRYEAGSVLVGRVLGHDEAEQLTRLQVRGGDLLVARFDAPVGSSVRVHIRARDVILATERPSHISTLNILTGVISGIAEAEGPAVEVAVDCSGERLLARITRRSLRLLDLAPGRPVFAVMKSVAVGRRDLGVAPPES
ncbi:molybdenum ABC transporter ATP-binding protein [Propylenella binzhouense]|uniref:Molybdenum ABC transporter ATP-binding protein n=1 Tax=Propylenella binzhouense TaxID=2555902 RepID=A0A964T484_9HYPH|nr:molybdenum ABC transporter ATP-binding protein [Propylenella binzhouense]MYZ47905.1 molybdenum ABC transporter ATP-binding protein [Propylenella binzhouense]